MELVVIPGFSEKNLDWINYIENSYSDNYVIKKILWSHWSGLGVSLNDDIGKVLIELKEPYCVIAKSIGTWSYLNWLSKNKLFPSKLVLCGVPLNDLSTEEKQAYRVLSEFPANSICVFQNDKDSHGSFEEVRKFLQNIAPNVLIVEKTANHHDYYYGDDFDDFLR